MFASRKLLQPALLLLFASVLAPAALACEDNEDASASPSLSATTSPAGTTATPATAASPSPAGTQAPPGPTGIAAVDTTMLLIAARDLERIMPRVTLTPMACAANPGGLGGPPRCEPGEAAGTIVKVFAWGVCELEYAREPAVREIIATAIQSLVLSPMTVIRIAGVTKLGAQPGDQYGLVYRDTRQGTGAAMFALDDSGRITRLYRGCTATAEELIERAGGKGAVIFPK